MPLAVAALYKFVALPDFRALQAPLRDLCAELGVTGTLLLAPEGINGTVAGESAAIDALLEGLRFGPLFDGRLSDIEPKLSNAEAQPFKRLKVRLKREIVTLGDPAADPTVRTGAYVAPCEWNALIARDDVVVVDVRNAFEVAMGSFDGAVNPRTKRFGDFKGFAAGTLAGARPKTVALYCTGGIRCEKASSHLLANGFSDVCQLKGGILKYLEEVDPADSLWRGSCFVFDERVALGHGLVEQTPEHADV
ncbi:rhodanese-related sulfurtransferase [Hansschlegelia plantiphila]|uniref:tRNA uridine(34) hydroxylase n=1 Tax=Hansschlegelia plantiphila TaxID=374655 RepID=A0A9W6IZL0_9HYPH|nr:rhodanese-like domain-containing protein [Hansschlegelia plantiphila]GLK68086.1 UPF0176 protein [Hansschlegelia plantiphila]